MAEDSIVWPLVGSREQRLSAQENIYDMFLGLNDKDIRHLHTIALCVTPISFLASVASLYWLVRMRRSFRHE